MCISNALDFVQYSHFCGSIELLIFLLIVKLDEIKLLLILLNVNLY